MRIHHGSPFEKHLLHALTLVKGEKLKFPPYETDVSRGGHDGFDPVRGTDPAQLRRGPPAIEEITMSSPLRRLRHITVFLAAMCLVTLLLVLSVKSGTPTLPAEGAVAPHSTTQATGYDLVGSDGGVFVFHGGFYGSLPGLGIHVDNIVGIAPAANYGGYYLVGSDGGVFSFGDTAYEGSLPGLGIHVNDVVGIVPSSDDKGYFLVGADGGVFSFGDTAYEGSLPGLGVHVDDVAGIAATPSNTGYWVLQANGQVTGFGDAPNLNLTASSGQRSDPLRVHRLDIGWAGLLGHEQLRSGVPRRRRPLARQLVVQPEQPGVDRAHWGQCWLLDRRIQRRNLRPGRRASYGSLPALGIVPNLPIVGAAPTVALSNIRATTNDNLVYAN